MEALLQDLRYALRTLRERPALAAVVVLRRNDQTELPGKEKAPPPALEGRTGGPGYDKRKNTWGRLEV